jgi:hypothetical protein
MKKQPIDSFREARHAIDPVLTQHEFSFQEGTSGPSSGGEYASGAYVNGNRKLELHYRSTLGLVTYHFDKASLDHTAYMRVLLGDKGGNKYPGFSDDPVAAFESLAYDLEHFATAFLEGNFEEFARIVKTAEEWNKISGFARLP